MVGCSGFNSGSGYERDHGDNRVEETPQAGHRPRAVLLDTRGMIWLISGDPKKAQDDLQAASTASPSPVYWYHLARAYDAQKMSAERNVALDRAKKLGLKKGLLHPLEWSGV